MDGFFHACGLPNVFSTIDGSHISLSQKPINGLLQYLQIIVVDGKVVIQLFLQAICDMDKLFWNVCCSIPSGTTNGGEFKVSSIYQQLPTRSIFKKPIVMVESLEIKPYLLINACYATRDYHLCNFKPIDGNLDKIIFDQQTNSFVGQVNIENAFWDS
jgi:hypothetical protein